MKTENDHTNFTLNRRKFLTKTGITATGLAVSPHLTFAEVPDNPLQSDRKIKIGIVGGGCKWGGVDFLQLG